VWSVVIAYCIRVLAIYHITDHRRTIDIFSPAVPALNFETETAFSGPGLEAKSCLPPTQPGYCLRRIPGAVYDTGDPAID
jgi:hypothetical protein